MKSVSYLGEEKMQFLELAKKRFSVRNFKPKRVEEVKLKKIIEAARVAPSAVNYQPWHFVVLTDEMQREAVSSTYNAQWIRSAPVIVAACGDHSKSWKRGDGKDHLDIDVAIAIDHMTLAAAELGLGTCWVCAFDEEKCRLILGLPDSFEVIALIPLGYPDEEGDTKRFVVARKKLEEIVHWNSYE
jgi:nitroreductase